MGTIAGISNRHDPTSEGRHINQLDTKINLEMYKNYFYLNSCIKRKQLCISTETEFFSFMKVGVVFVGIINISRHIKEELAWATVKLLRLLVI